MKKVGWVVALIIGVVILVTVGWLLWSFNLWPFQGRIYSMEELGIERLRAETDFDGDGIDDYTDIMLGARKDAENHPRYDGSYVQGGYPPDEVGVCTDAIWRAFREAGYDFRAMVDEDIRERPGAYSWIEQPDTNIDFRRVRNLQTYFEEYAEKLTIDTNDVSAWQPGDIVIFDHGNHIGVVSDRRNRKGQPYIIHNAGQPEREEDYLKRAQPEAHYRMKWPRD